MSTPARRPARNTDLAGKVNLYSAQRAESAPETTEKKFQDIPVPGLHDTAPTPEATKSAVPELPAYRPPAKVQVKAYVPEDVAERFQDAWHACRGLTGHRYQSEHITALLAAEAERLEAEHNGGRRFPPRKG